MAKTALWVLLEAKPGKEADVEKFLNDGLQLVEQEPATTHGSRCGLGVQPLASSMPFLMKPGTWHTLETEWLLH